MAFSYHHSCKPAQRAENQRVRIHVLGSAAGGGVPQWNCACPNCREARRAAGGEPRVKVTPRTQDSIAIGAAGGWILCNASPDLRAQIARFAPETPPAAVVLTNGDLDHCLGLFSLRSSEPLAVYATETVWKGLSRTNAIFHALERFPRQITWRPLRLGRRVELELDGIAITAFASPGRLPPHLQRDMPPDPEDNVALLVEERGGARVLYAPGVAAVDPIARHLEGTDVLFFDGTSWEGDEPAAHVPIGGARGSLARLARRACGRRIYTHVRNTNPILWDGSPERCAVERAGWEVASDGMELGE
jgi:pyrroloquinoline quinone biosynthesis protein B